MLTKKCTHIAESLAKMSTASKYTRTILLAFFAFFCVFAIGRLGLGLFSSFSTDTFNFWLIPDLLSLFVTGFCLFTLIILCDDISKKKSPFSIKQAGRIKLIGWLLLTNVVLEAFFSISGSSFQMYNGVEWGIASTTSQSNYPTLFINGYFVVGAIICFCLSYAFKYGALLQQLSDDTV